MNELLANARQKTNTIHVTFFDLADAFGSVEHNLIHHTLQRNGISSSICDYVENLYSRLQGQLKDLGGYPRLLTSKEESFKVTHYHRLSF